MFAIAQAGTVRLAGRVETTPEALEVFAAGLVATGVVALEVTGNAGEVARILEPHVARVVVVSPHDTGISRARAQTDPLGCPRVGQAAGCR
jgi:transposase